MIPKIYLIKYKKMSKKVWKHALSTRYQNIKLQEIKIMGMVQVKEKTEHWKRTVYVNCKIKCKNKSNLHIHIILLSNF